MDKTGFIYILTNESFHRDNWIKIGYAEDVDKRVKDLSNTSVPLPYEVYCTYEIPRIQGKKDPDKLLHELINKLNPSLRISPHREFFEMYPWDAYDMLLSIAQMHGRTDKFLRNEDNTSGQDVACDTDYTVDSLFPNGSTVRVLYDRLKTVVLSIDPCLVENPRMIYVSFKKNKHNTLALWPKNDYIEVVLNAKIGQIIDDYDMIYDISNRKWSSEQYAFKYYVDSDANAVKDLLEQTIKLKK